MKNIGTFERAVLEIRPKKPKSEPKLNLDPFPPARTNFQIHDIWLKLRVLTGSKFMPKIKKI